ncbi:hypothetical protein QJS04_geneDACA003371 [Acorus gramineus]|uniref:Uncharacterized protein n=1 Tax=Acorus gramineus TaxID=55184 RepID=A0AAV9BQN1_ACOGR|nr:hypothetical protein QJS04_geneDACA003371 [Acorus gramineus]
MGCGGSKQDVATGNTTATQRPSRRKPGAKNKKLDPIPEVVVAAAANGDRAKKGTLEKPASENTKPPLSDVKDIRVNTEGKCDNGVDSCKGWQGVVDQGGGVVVIGEEKTVSRESPDRYFSSRKDDEESVVGGNLEGEYFSPDRVAVVTREDDRGKAEAEVEEKVLERNAKDGATANVEDCKKEEPLEEKVLVDEGRVEEGTCVLEF